jgi:uncharacterized protein (DUF2336 family)
MKAVLSKKLSLARETLRNLTREELTGVAGGSATCNPLTTTIGVRSRPGVSQCGTTGTVTTGTTGVPRHAGYRRFYVLRLEVSVKGQCLVKAITSKRISLNKQTLRHLTQSDLSQVLGVGANTRVGGLKCLVQPRLGEAKSLHEAE